MIIAFTRLHYGKDYLGYVIRSALPFVDKFVVLYTSVASDGFRGTSQPCPDTRDELFAIASEAAGGKLDWREGLSISAGVAMGLYPEADVAIEMDADEVYHPDLLSHIVDSYNAGRLTQYCYRLPFWHHWRTFDAVCEDGGWPARLYLPKRARADAVFYDGAPARVHHFGYARSTSDMQYKWLTSVHGNELRPEWWGEIWSRWPERTTDLHPVSRDYWNAQLIDRDCLPAVLRDHPYADKAVIE